MTGAAITGLQEEVVNMVRAEAPEHFSYTVNKSIANEHLGEGMMQRTAAEDEHPGSS